MPFLLHPERQRHTCRRGFRRKELTGGKADKGDPSDPVSAGGSAYAFLLLFSSPRDAVSVAGGGRHSLWFRFHDAGIAETATGKQ